MAASTCPLASAPFHWATCRRRLTLTGGGGTEVRNGGDLQFDFLKRFLIAAERGTAHYEEEQFLSKVFIWVATIFLAWLVFVY